MEIDALELAASATNMFGCFAIFSARHFRMTKIFVGRPDNQCLRILLEAFTLETKAINGKTLKYQTVPQWPTLIAFLTEGLSKNSVQDLTTLDPRNFCYQSIIKYWQEIKSVVSSKIQKHWKRFSYFISLNYCGEGSFKKGQRSWWN